MPMGTLAQGKEFNETSKFEINIAQITADPCVGISCIRPESSIPPPFLHNPRTIVVI